MEPRIEILPEKKLIGKRMKMTFLRNKTGELWKSFMQRRKEEEVWIPIKPRKKL